MHVYKIIKSLNRSVFDAEAVLQEENLILKMILFIFFVVVADYKNLHIFKM
jgi:hypothetical protein